LGEGRGSNKEGNSSPLEPGYLDGVSTLKFKPEQPKNGPSNKVNTEGVSDRGYEGFFPKGVTQKTFQGFFWGIPLREFWASPGGFPIFTGRVWN